MILIAKERNFFSNILLFMKYFIQQTNLFVHSFIRSFIRSFLRLFIHLSAYIPDESEKHQNRQWFEKPYTKSNAADL